MFLTPLEKQLLPLDEENFHRKIQKYIKETGKWHEILIAIIQFNTSYYLLKRFHLDFWIESIYQKNQRIALAVSETNWKGKIKNIKSTVIHSSSGYYLSANKSYVFKAGLYLIVAKYENELAICCILENDPIQLKKKFSTQLYDSHHHSIIEHYECIYESLVPSKHIYFVPFSDYTRLAFQISLREMTSLSWMILELSRYYTMLDWISNQKIVEIQNEILQLRKKNRIPVASVRKIVHIVYPVFEEMKKRQDPSLGSIQKIFDFFNKNL